MSRKKMIILIAALALYAYHMKSRSVTLTRLSHLDLDPKRARKAYNKMMLDALTGKSNYEGLSDAEMDAVLLERYYDLEK